MLNVAVVAEAAADIPQAVRPIRVVRAAARPIRAAHVARPTPAVRAVRPIQALHRVAAATPRQAAVAAPTVRLLPRAAVIPRRATVRPRVAAAIRTVRLRRAAARTVRPRAAVIRQTGVIVPHGVLHPTPRLTAALRPTVWYAEPTGVRDRCLCQAASVVRHLLPVFRVRRHQSVVPVL
jgi:hypothetical protein